MTHSVKLFGVAEGDGVGEVFFAQHDFVTADGPLDAEFRVIKTDGAFGFGGVAIIYLVGKNCCVTQHLETVGEATRDEELAIVFGGEFNGNVTTKGGGGAAKIHCHIHHGALEHSDEFRLRGFTFLKVKSTQHAAR